MFNNAVQPTSQQKLLEILSENHAHVPSLRFFVMICSSTHCHPSPLNIFALSIPTPKKGIFSAQILTEAPAVQKVTKFLQYIAEQKWK